MLTLASTATPPRREPTDVAFYVAGFGFSVDIDVVSGAVSSKVIGGHVLAGTIPDQVLMALVRRVTSRVLLCSFLLNRTPQVRRWTLRDPDHRKTIAYRMDSFLRKLFIEFVFQSSG